MQTWISQAKEHMMDIIDQTRRDEPNLHLRVAFVGYVFIRNPLLIHYHLPSILRASMGATQYRGVGVTVLPKQVLWPVFRTFMTKFSEICNTTMGLR